MTRKEYYRGMEDPISGTFELAEEVSNKADRVLSRFGFALYFTWFSLIVAGILMLAVLSNGQFFIFLVMLSVFVSGIVTVWLLRNTREFLRKASFRFNAIQRMREGPPAYSVPKGKNKTERFLNYLRKNNRAFSKMMRKRPEHLRKDAYIVGKKGRYHFDAFLVIKPSLIHRFVKRGYPGYAIFVREYKRAPGEKDLKRLLRELADIRKRTKVYPSRVVLLFKAGGGYSGLDEEAYEMITSSRVTLPGVYNRRMNMQVVGEMPEKVYDFTPFIPEIKGYLP
ncbi:MAG: hypothetical protein U9R75_05080 [Candidatus Thermoplasmatota archaeon]|nr:hypothetical protein [Candidatus Thermoplasmatota archaeon]